METAIKIYFGIGILLAALMPLCAKEIMQAKEGEYPEEHKEDVEKFQYTASILPAWAMSLAMTMYAALLIFAWPAFVRIKINKK